MKLVFEGSCTVERIAELKQMLARAMEGGKKQLELCFENVTEADLSFFQLLHAAVKMSQKRGPKLIFRPNLPESLTFKAVKTGMTHITTACSQK